MWLDLDLYLDRWKRRPYVPSKCLESLILWYRFTILKTWIIKWIYVGFSSLLGCYAVPTDKQLLAIGSTSLSSFLVSRSIRRIFWSFETWLVIDRPLVFYTRQNWIFSSAATITSKPDIYVPCMAYLRYFSNPKCDVVTGWCSYVKVKVKCSRYRPRMAQRVDTGIALLFHDRGTRRR